MVGLGRCGGSGEPVPREEGLLFQKGKQCASTLSSFIGQNFVRNRRRHCGFIARRRRKTMIILSLRAIRRDRADILQGKTAGGGKAYRELLNS